MGRSKKQIANIHDICLSSDNIITDDVVLHQLKCRYETNQLYTRVSDGILIAMSDSNKIIDHNEQISLDYVSEYKHNSGEATLKLPPHIYQTVNQIYLHMRRTNIDQSILLRYYLHSNDYQFIFYQLLKIAAYLAVEKQR